jgi:hypothetical protein
VEVRLLIVFNRFFWLGFSRLPLLLLSLPPLPPRDREEGGKEGGGEGGRWKGKRWS